MVLTWIIMITLLQAPGPERVGERWGEKGERQGTNSEGKGSRKGRKGKKNRERVRRKERDKGGR